MKYSIVIPTFERPENLALILQRLAQSVSNRTHVLILTEPESSSLPTDEQLVALSEKLDIEVSFNKCKAGVDESILRAYEQCTSEWIYFLGDSKLPMADFEAAFTSASIAAPKVSAYFFQYDSKLNSGQVIHSIEELVASGLTLGDFILGGNALFSRRIVEKYITYSYRTLSSRIAHVAMPLMALAKGESVYLSNQIIIDKFIEKPQRYNPGKALLDCWASFPLLVLLPLDKYEAVLLNKYIISNENNSDRINFVKYCLIKIFKEKINISKDLNVIMKTRYIFYSHLIEKVVIFLLLVISSVLEFVKRK